MKSQPTTAERWANLPQDVQAKIAEYEAKGKPVNEVHCLSVAKAPTSEEDRYLVADGDEVPNAYVGYVRDPDRHVMNSALAELPDLQEAGHILLMNCFLGGDEEIKKVPTVRRFAAIQCAKLLEVHRTALKKV